MKGLNNLIDKWCHFDEEWESKDYLRIQEAKHNHERELIRCVLKYLGESTTNELVDEIYYKYIGGQHRWEKNNITD